MTGLGLGQGIQYSGIEHLNISLGTGPNGLNVQSTAANTLTVVNTGASSSPNVIDVGSLAPGSNGNVNNINGKLTIVGLSSNDTVNVDDTGDSVANTGLLTATRLTGLGMGGDDPTVDPAASKGIEYSGIELLTISLGSGADRFTILSTHSNRTIVNAGSGADRVAVRSVSGPTAVNGGDGSDTFYVGSDATLGATPDADTNANGVVNGIAAELALSGGLNTSGVGDVANIDNTGDVGRDGFLTATRIWGLNMPGSSLTTNGITDGTLEFLNISLGTTDDTFNVLGAHAGQTRILGLGGNDTFNVGSLAPNVGSTAPAGVVDGVLGCSSSTPGWATRTSSMSMIPEIRSATRANSRHALTGLGMGAIPGGTGTVGSSAQKAQLDNALLGITYTHFAALNVRLGTGADVFFIESTMAPYLSDAGTTARHNHSLRRERRWGELSSITRSSRMSASTMSSTSRRSRGRRRCSAVTAMTRSTCASTSMGTGLPTLPRTISPRSSRSMASPAATITPSTAAALVIP